MLIRKHRISSRDYALVIQHQDVTAIYTFFGYIMRCVQETCKATNVKSETAHLYSEDDWAPYRYGRGELESQVSENVAKRIRQTHMPAVMSAAGAVLAALKPEQPVMLKKNMLRFKLLGTDTVFDAKGNSQILEVNHTPELFCHPGWEGRFRPAVNKQMVDVVTTIISCWNDNKADLPLMQPHECDQGLDPQYIYKREPGSHWSAGSGSKC